MNISGREVFYKGECKRIKRDGYGVMSYYSEINMKVIGRMIKKKEMEHIIIKVVQSIKENGKREKEMVME